jgi:hypothetical protein
MQKKKSKSCFLASLLLLAPRCFLFTLRSKFSSLCENAKMQRRSEEENAQKKKNEVFYIDVFEIEDFK